MGESVQLAYHEHFNHDRRQAIRVPCSFTTIDKGKVTDISRTGAHLESREDFTLQQKVRLNFFLPDGKPTYVDSTVCRKHSTKIDSLKGYGLEFDFKENPFAESDITSFIIKYLERQKEKNEKDTLTNQTEKQESTLNKLQLNYRSPRLSKEILDQLNIEAYIEHKKKKYTAKLENISDFGFCIKIPSNREIDSALKSNSILHNITLAIDERKIFQGRAKIIHTKKIQELTSLGCYCMDGISISLKSLTTSKIIQQAQAQFQDFLYKTNISKKIHPKFKIALNDFRFFLESMKSYLYSTQANIENELDTDEQQYALTFILKYSEEKLIKSIHLLIEELENIVTTFDGEENIIHRKYFQEQLLGLIKDCSFFKRAFEKPLGYAGDYELMNMLYHKIHEGKDLWNKLINSCLTTIPAGDAVRNRGAYLSKKIESITENNKNIKNINILSLACGPCEEVLLYLKSKKTRPDIHIQFYLIDQEVEALNFAQKKLYKEISKQNLSQNSISLTFLKQGVKDFIKNTNIIDSYPKMDLIYSAGLYDYLPKNVASNLTQVLVEMLKKDGLLTIGNFSRGYGKNFFIEYASDWFLILRNSEELQALLPSSEKYSKAIIEKENTGSNLFLNVRK